MVKIFKKIIIDDVTPGPSSYIIKPLIDGVGITFNSNFKSSTSKSMSGKVIILKNINPSILFIDLLF